MRVAGIDPGSRFTGWGIVAEESGVLRLIECGVIKAELSDDSSFSGRLAHIYHHLCLILKRYRPDTAAIEQTFASRNPQSALKLGQARGVAVAACAALGLDIFDYEPTLIKKSIVGTGRAEKEQVAFMVKRILNIKEAAWALDTSDALAAAICHFNHARMRSLVARADAASGKIA